jgi:hypothetical protein
MTFAAAIASCALTWPLQPLLCHNHLLPLKAALTPARLCTPVQTVLCTHLHNEACCPACGHVDVDLHVALCQVVGGGQLAAHDDRRTADHALQHPWTDLRKP